MEKYITLIEQKRQHRHQNDKTLANWAFFITLYFFFMIYFTLFHSLERVECIAIMS